MKTVYLAGPITGLSWLESEYWRDQIQGVANSKFPELAKGVKFLSPMRGKDFLQYESKIKDSYTDNPFASSKAIMLRDFHDVSVSDALIVNLSHCQTVSIGTVMEIAWAYQRRIPVICIQNSQNTLHEHSMLNEAIWWKVNGVAEALDVLNTLFVCEVK